MSARGFAFAATLAVALAFALDVAHIAEACGGPSYADLGALEKVDTTLAAMRVKDPDWSPMAREELRFLYPFYREHPAELESLWNVSYGERTSVPGPSLDAFEKAVEAFDLDSADREARAAIEAILALPAALGSEHTEALWRAVEFVEILPRLRGEPKDFVRGLLLGPTPGVSRSPLVADVLDGRWATPGSTHAIPSFSAAHARAASLELWSMQRDFRAAVPDGYAGGAKNEVPDATFAAFEKRVDTWLAAHPKHPLADYAVLWKERVRYFEGDVPGAWRLLFDVYPRHRPRVLGEMRYLLLQGKPPSAAQIDKLSDKELIAGFASAETISAARFAKWWKLAETEPSRPCSINLEERLLLWAAERAKPGALPDAFPREARDPTPLWGKLRAAALAKSGDLAGARAEIRDVAVDAEQGRIAAQVEIASGRPAAAAKLPGLGDDARAYLLRVRTSDAALGEMAKSKGPAAAPARFEAGVRLVAKGEWKSAAAQIEKDDPERAELWRRAGALAEKHGAKADLAFARFLEENQATLLYPTDPGFYRSVVGRYDLALDRSDSKPIEIALTRGTARWLALRAYARALDESLHSEAASDVLAETNREYNRLINWAGGGFWAHYATKTTTAAAIQRAGKVIKRAGAR